MIRYLFALLICTAFFCCKQEIEPEIPEDVQYVLPCGCEEGWAGEESEYPWELAWDFPISTGGGPINCWDEWKKLPTLEERLEALQVPEDILSSLPTQDLLMLCMKMFLHTSFFGGSVFERHLEVLKEMHNCFEEFCKREDTLEAMLTVYRRAHPIPDPDVTGWQGEIEILEILLGLYQSKDNRKEEYITILQHLFCGYENQALHYCGDSILRCHLRSNTFARAKMLSKLDEKFVLQLPLKDQTYVLLYGVLQSNDSSMCIINEFSCKYIFSKQ